MAGAKSGTELVMKPLFGNEKAAGRTLGAAAAAPKLSVVCRNVSR
ncbi:Hypothetical protein BJL86_2031 [Dietzia timorensis]|uniref:Uncharacterized protein n=1 Tax=Dietzia timorensis TaxID=499555 RepID=A0A173LMI1_9ACTN|nr:Hypothetical protein BJL86_2031 [Dietzia timorensis]